MLEEWHGILKLSRRQFRCGPGTAGLVEIFESGGGSQSMQREVNGVDLKATPPGTGESCLIFLAA